MKIKVMPPQGEIKVRISGLIPPKKYLKEFRRQLKLAAQIEANLAKEKQ